MDNSICAYWLVLQLCGIICLGIRVLRIALIKALLNSAAKSHVHYHEMCPVITQDYHSWHMKGGTQTKPPLQLLLSQRSVFQGLPSHMWSCRFWVLCNSAPHSRLCWDRAILREEAKEAEFQSFIVYNSMFGKHSLCVHIILLLTLTRLQNWFTSNCNIRQKRQYHHTSFCHAVLLPLTMFLNSEYHPK